MKKAINRRTLSNPAQRIASPAVQCNSASAQAKVIKIGHVSPTHRAARRLRRGRHIHPRTGARHPRQGPAKRRQDLQGRDHLQGQPVERQPRRRGRVRTDPSATRSTCSSPPPRPTPPIRWPIRPRSMRSLASPPTVRGSRISSAARATRRRASPGPIISSGVSRTSSPRSWRCGTARRPTRSSAACSRTMPTATPGAIRSSACRRRSAKAGYKLLDPGRYQVMNNDFTSQISAFKAAGARDRHRQHDPAGLRHVLVAGGAAGLQAEDRHHRQGAAVPLGDQLARRARQRAHHRRCGGRRTIRSSPASPGRAAQQLADAYTNATKRPWTQPIGFQHALFEVAIDVLKRAKTIEPKSILDSIVATNYKSIVGPVQWTGKPVKNVTKTPLVAGQWQRKGGKFELVITGEQAGAEHSGRRQAGVAELGLLSSPLPACGERSASVASRVRGP